MCCVRGGSVFVVSLEDGLDPGPQVGVQGLHGEVLDRPPDGEEVGVSESFDRCEGGLGIADGLEYPSEHVSDVPAVMALAEVGECGDGLPQEGMFPVFMDDSPTEI